MGILLPNTGTQIAEGSVTDERPLLTKDTVTVSMFSFSYHIGFQLYSMSQTKGNLGGEFYIK